MTCCEPLRVGEHVPRQVRSSSMSKSELLGFGHVAEGALDVILQIAEAQLADIHVTVPDSILDRSRMSLMRVSRSLPEA